MDFPAKSPWLYYRLVRLKHNHSLLLQGILNKANPDRATVTTDPAGVRKASKASVSVPARALLLMVDNPAGPVRNIQMTHPENRREETRGEEGKGKERTVEDKLCGGRWQGKARKGNVEGKIKR